MTVPVAGSDHRNPAGVPPQKFFAMQIMFTSDEIAAIVQPRAVRGSTDVPIKGISALRTGRSGDLSFLGQAKYKADVAATQASVVLIPQDYRGDPKAESALPGGRPAISRAGAAVCPHRAGIASARDGRRASLSRGGGRRHNRSERFDRSVVRDRGGGVHRGARVAFRRRCMLDAGSRSATTARFLPGVRVYAGSENRAAGADPCQRGDRVRRFRLRVHRWTPRESAADWAGP